MAVTDLVDQAEQRSYVSDVPRHRKVLYCADERIARPDVCCCYLESGELNRVFREVEFLWVLSDAVSSAYIHPFAGLEERFFYCRGPHAEVVDALSFVWDVGNDFIVSSSVAISGSDEPLGQGLVPVSAPWRDECGVVTVVLVDGD